MPKNKTVSINTEAAHALEDVMSWEIAGWAEDLAHLAGGGHASRDEITEALWQLMPLIKQRQAAMDAGESGEAPKKLFVKHAAEVAEVLSQSDAPTEPFDELALRVEMMGDRASAIISVPLDFDFVQELCDVGRAGSENLQHLAVNVCEAIMKEDELRNGSSLRERTERARPVAV